MTDISACGRVLNISLPAVSRSCDCHVFDKAFRSIMEGTRLDFRRWSAGSFPEQRLVIDEGTIGSTFLREQFVR